MNFPISLFQQALLHWYFQYGRLDLPWRNLQGQVSNPPLNVSHIDRVYGVYISEIMLQQTQVSVVLDRFFFPFLQSFPSLESLALSKEEEVLKLWQGLGYYSRARNLRQSAILCHKHFNSQLPQSREKLKTLSGIGEYTSGAILCFGFGECVSFVDGNIARVISRLFALSKPTQNILQDLAHKLLNPLDPFNHNQALIDFGATLCTPKNPNCLLCPMHSFCLGKNSPHQYPTPQKSSLTPLQLHLGFLKQDQKISLLKSKTKLYQGLYNPIFLAEKPKQKPLGSFTHHYTKYIINAQVYLCNELSFEDLEFFSLDEIHQLPVSNLCKKALKILCQN